ncbi:elongation factor Ts, mitochondrial-like [Saccoglossus kowalevskii]|uniref:Elongation factor Ts, mitochondrial n=1 Tax=Saccoglossus kowalevskii TaxID=10224 RepID=A0ABM0GN90_SACKO|nr:PREDICTED: elongation factor Ts, mitochondrial-like [Saccoglossus kowalevskii]
MYSRVLSSFYIKIPLTMFAMKKLFIATQCCRLIHNSTVLQGLAATGVKSNLAKLRKKTGFSFANCKKALNKFENNLEQAESWLKEQAQKEGWAKATKLQGRKTAQGVIGVLCQQNSAAVVEVNCETDFVAKNTKFQNFVSQVAMATIHQNKHLNADNSNHIKTNISGEELSNITTEDSKSLQELLVLTIGQLGENASIRRGVFLSVPSDVHIGSYVHSTLEGQPAGKNKCAFGKYGAVVAFKRTLDIGAPFNVSEFGRRLGQHVVGMSPTSIGTAKPVEELKPVSETKPVEETKKSDEEDGEDEESTPSQSWTIDETEMLKQEFLLDPSITVAELLQQEGVQVLDFIRYECGEEIL